MIQRLLKLKYIILFLLLIYITITITIFLHDDAEKKIYLNNKTNLAKVEYETIYLKIKEQSEMIFQEDINTKEIINIFKNAHNATIEEKAHIRTKLYNTLLPSYRRLTKLINLKQVHFHLPNNHSFLRMHRVNKFGDDLTNIRQTVAYVNKYREKIDGFEEGRIYNGFRFVYPLFDENQIYLGSMEVSFSALSFQKTLSNDVRFSQFLFSKEIIDEKVWKDEYELNYTQAAISPLFVLESNWKDDQFSDIKRQIMKSLTPEIKNKFKTNLKQKEPYSLTIKINESTLILSFIPIKNPVNDKLVAYLVMITEGLQLNRINFENKIFLLALFALLLCLFIIIYRQNKYQDDLQKQKDLFLEQSKMAQMGSLLNNIAHQWKQPLARINAKLLEIPLTLNLNELEARKLEYQLENIEDLTLYMAKTIESFRSFFHPNKELNEFSINLAIDKAIALLNINDENINIILDYKNNLVTIGYEDELIQVLMVLIINAYEALVNSSVSDAYIKINVKKYLSKIEITIIDNAGGIDPNISKQIFNPYFSTKRNNNNNNGIGLYMAKMIIEVSMKGKLTYQRKNEKSNFYISLQGLDNE